MDCVWDQKLKYAISVLTERSYDDSYTIFEHSVFGKKPMFFVLNSVYRQTSTLTTKHLKSAISFNRECAKILMPFSSTPYLT